MTEDPRLLAEDAGIPLRCLPDGAFGPTATDTDLLSLFSGWVCLTTNLDGSMPHEPLAAFTAFGTRLVTGYRFRVNGRPPQATLCSPIGPSEWTGLFAVKPERSFRTPARRTRPPAGTITLRILRRVDDAWTEEYRLEGCEAVSSRVTLDIEWSSPVDDVELVHARRRTDGRAGGKGLVPMLRRSGTMSTLLYRRQFGRRHHAPAQELRRFLGSAAPRDGSPVERGLTVTLRGSEALQGRISVLPGRISRVRIEVRLVQGKSATATLRFEPGLCDTRLRIPASPRSDLVPRTARSCQGRTRIRCGNPTLDLLLSQTQEDVSSLRLGLEGPERMGQVGSPVLMGGIPRYIGIFTRDALIAAHQAAIFSSTLLEDALARTAAYQGVRTDPWRDEEPGRLHHERRLGPESVLGRSNRELYYGDTLGTPYWIHGLAEAYRWTGDRELLRRHSGTLDRAVAWLLRSLARYEGLLYYKSRSAQGNRHQGWKDSNDAIVDGRGRPMDPPLGTVELQGYAHLALEEAARIRDLLGAPDDAAHLRGAADRLRKRFEKQFWDPALGFYALAVDGNGRRANAVASNPGHCLLSGLVGRIRGARVVRRMERDDLYSGWGIRTLSSKNPAYDPFSYHRGSVWPVDNARIALNFRSVGARRAARRIIGAQLAAATCFPRMRLPETMSGHPRSPEHPMPGLYPESNLIQAWSVSAVFSFIQTLLGIRPRADQHVLLVDPDLPAWLPWIELRELRVGGDSLDLGFRREASGRCRWQVLGGPGKVRVLERDWADDRAENNPRARRGSAG